MRLWSIVKTKNFKAEEYFTHHPDILISTLAVKLSVDRFQLSESMQMKEREIDLRDRVMHLNSRLSYGLCGATFKRIASKFIYRKRFE